ncbi:MAG: hypothetical protein ACLQIB_24050 [Isosphaeraceae bacterium]
MSNSKKLPESPGSAAALVVERVQTGVRLEKRLLKVLKALAEYHDLSLGDLLEGIVLHAFDGKCPFEKESLALIADLKQIYHLDLDYSSSHRLTEHATEGKPGTQPKRSRQRKSK